VTAVEAVWLAAILATVCVAMFLLGVQYAQAVDEQRRQADRAAMALLAEQGPYTTPSR
jgi:hypothetical protein